MYSARLGVPQIRAILFATAIITNAQAIEHPHWDELVALLGRPIESDEVIAFANNHELRQYHKFDEGGFVANDNSFSLLFRKNCISTIVLRVAPLPKGYGEPHWRPFSQPLPGGLEAADSLQEIVAKLGQPLNGQANRWQVKDVIVWVHFADGNRAIEELFVSGRPQK